VNKQDLRIYFGNYTIAQKYNYFQYRRIGKKKIIPFQPIEISIVSTGKCNLKCAMCVTHSKDIPDDYPYQQQPTADMSIDLFKKVVDKFHKALRVQIIGQGEPLLNKDFFEIVEYASKKKMRVTSFSNGTILDRYIDRLLHSSLEGLTISLNSYVASDFSRITKMPSHYFDVILKNSKKMIQQRNNMRSKLKIKASFILDQQNYSYMPKMLQIAESLGFDHMFFSNFLPIDVHPEYAAEVRCLFSDDEKVKLFLKNVVPRYLKSKVSLPKLLLRNPDQHKRCNCHISQIRVDGDGDVNSCSIMLLNMKNNGHILDPQVWNNSFFQKMRKKFIESDVKELEGPCKVCTSNYGLSV